MSWCDKLASTPVVGLRFTPHYQSSDSILDAISPLLNQWVDGRRQRFTIQRQESFGVHLVTDDGFQYSFDQRNIIIEFKHRLRVKSQSGKPPIAELLSRPLPYTELLTEVLKRVDEAFSLLAGSKPRMLERIGIVSTTITTMDEVPPGVVRLIQYMGRPWRHELDHFDFNITGRINSTNEYADRCMHTVIRPEDPEELMTIKFDWQRTFVSPKVTASDFLRKHLASAEKDALAYFEEVGEGGRFDEDLIRNPA